MRTPIILFTLFLSFLANAGEKYNNIKVLQPSYNVYSELTKDGEEFTFLGTKVHYNPTSDKEILTLAKPLKVLVYCDNQAKELKTIKEVSIGYGGDAQAWDIELDIYKSYENKSCIISTTEIPKELLGSKNGRNCDFCKSTKSMPVKPNSHMPKPTCTNQNIHLTNNKTLNMVKVYQGGAPSSLTYSLITKHKNCNVINEKNIYSFIQV